MPSIYGRLFAYREREHRAPLEDFLSEALADLLNRLPKERMIAFVGDLMMEGGKPRDAWCRYAQTCNTFVWSTQRRILWKDVGYRADILLEADGREALVIETKIGSSLREHKQAQIDGTVSATELETNNQLQTYGCWLASKCAGRNWGGALILLTHSSAVPKDFGTGHGRTYGVPWQHTCHWSSVWRWLTGGDTRRSGHPESLRADGGPVWSALASELAQFLQERNMATDTMTAYDIAAAQIFVGSADRINQTFESIGEKLATTLRELMTSRPRGVWYDSEFQAVWDWAYLKEPYAPKGVRWHFGWGIRFIQPSSYWIEAKPRLPGATYAFITLSSDNDRDKGVFASVPSKHLPPGWLFLPECNDFVSARPLHEFPSDATELTDALGDWIQAGLKRFQPLLPLLAGGKQTWTGEEKTK